MSRPRKTEISEAYEITLILGKADTAKLVKQCREAYVEQEGEDPPANFQIAVHKVEEEDDKFRISFRRKAKTKKGMDASPVIVFDAFGSESFREIPNGSLGRVKFLPFSYTYAGKKGISMYLVSVQLLKAAAGGAEDVGFEVDEVTLAAQRELVASGVQPPASASSTAQDDDAVLAGFDDEIPF